MPSNLQLPDLLTPGSAAYLRKKQLFVGSPPEPPQPAAVQPLNRQPGPTAQPPAQPAASQTPASAKEQPQSPDAAPLPTAKPAAPAAQGKPPASTAPATPAPATPASPAAATVPQPATKTAPPAAQPPANPAATAPATPATAPAVKPQPPAAPPAVHSPTPSPAQTPTPAAPTPAAPTPAQPPKAPSRADAVSAMRDAAAQKAAAEKLQGTPPAPTAPPPPKPPQRGDAAEARRMADAKNAGAVIENGKLIPHPDRQGGVLHHTGFALIPDPTDPAKAPTVPYRNDPEKGPAIPYRDDHGKQHPIPVQDIRRVTGPDGKANYHFMVDGKPVSVPEGTTPLFQTDPDGKRFTTAADGTRRDLGYDRNAAAQAGVQPRVEAAGKALEEKLAQGADLKRQLTEKQAQATAAQQRLDAAHQAVVAADQATGPDSQTQRIRTREEVIRAEEALKQRQQEIQTVQKQHDAHYSALAHEQRARQAEIGQHKAAAAESPADAQWQKDANSMHGDSRATHLNLIAEAEKKDPASAAAMRQALVPQPTQRLFAAAEKSFGGAQPAEEGKSISLHDMLMQAPEMTQGQGARQTTVNQADAARATAQNSLGIADPENVRVTRSADGSYSLTRKAADGSGADQPFASLDPRTNRITLTPGPDGKPTQAAIDMAAQAAPDGTPIYLPGTQPPLSEAEVSGLIQKGLAATTSTTDRKAADAALTQAGLSPEGIQKMRNEGRLSVQDANFLNAKFNSGVGSYAQRDALQTAQKQNAGLQQMYQDTKAPADQPNFKSWMEKGDPQRDAQVQAKAKELGLSEDAVRQAMEDQRRTDFATPLTQEGHDQQSGMVNAFKRGVGMSGHDQDSTRTLTDGSLAVNPALTDDKAKFEKAIQDSNASPEAKAAALKNWPAQHEAWLTKATDTLKASKTLPGVEDYNEWLTKNTLAGHFSQKQPDGSVRQYTDNEKTQLYLDAMKNRSGVRKFMDMVGTSLVSGGGQVVSGLLGAAALAGNTFQDLTGVNVGGQAASEAAAAMAQQNQGLTQSNELTGNVSGAGSRFLSNLIQAVPSIGAAIASGGTAGLILGAAQSAGSTYTDLLQHHIMAGDSIEAAHKKAAGTAIASGAVGLALSKIMPGGSQALNNPATKKAFGTALKSFIKGGAEEISQEAIDGGFSHIASEMNKGKTFEQAATSYAEQFPQSALTSALLGGGVQAMADHRQAGDHTPTQPATAQQQSTPQQPASANPPAPSSQQAIPPPTTPDAEAPGSGKPAPATVGGTPLPPVQGAGADSAKPPSNPPTPDSPPPGISRTPTQTTGTGKPADSAQPPQSPSAKPSTPPLSAKQSQKLIENVSKLPAKAQEHPTTQANVAQANKVVAQEAVRSLEQKAQQNGGKLDAAESQALQKAKAEAGHADADAQRPNTEAGHADADAQRPNTEAGHADADAQRTNSEPGHPDANAQRTNTEAGRADAEAGNGVRDRQPSDPARNTPEPADTSTGKRHPTDSSEARPSNSPDSRPQDQPSGAARSRDGTAADPSRHSIPETTTHPDSDPAQPRAAASNEGRTPTPPDSSTSDGAAPRTASPGQPAPTNPTAPRAPGEAGSPGQPASPSRTSLPPPRTPPLSPEQSQRLLDNVAKMPEKAQQHPQVQADVAQARRVVDQAHTGPSSQNTSDHALHSEHGPESLHGTPQQNSGSWQKGNGKADTNAKPLTKEQWAARPEFKPDPNPVQAADLMTWSPEHPVSPEMKSNIMIGAQGLLDLLPREIAQSLGKVRLSVVQSLGKNVVGKYDPNSNTLILAHDKVNNFTPGQLSAKIWHEMGHWFYHRAGDLNAHSSLKQWRSAINEHWKTRTQDEDRDHNSEGNWDYIRDGWISDYAGRFYGNTGGLELPSVYLEAAAWGTGRLAFLGKTNKNFHTDETFNVIISIFNKQPKR